MTAADFKELLLQCLAEDEEFANKVLMSIADQCTLQVSTDWHSPGFIKVSLGLGTATLSDFATLDIPRDYSGPPYA